jgi:hypothetical protein
MRRKAEPKEPARLPHQPPTMRPGEELAAVSPWSAPFAVARILDGWQVVARYAGSDGTSVHTVEADGEGHYRCTCRGFVIHKRGFCRHTDRARREGK